MTGLMGVNPKFSDFTKQSTGSYSVNLVRGYYRIMLSSGGGGGAYSETVTSKTTTKASGTFHLAGGGGGASGEYIVFIPYGISATVKVGAGGTTSTNGDGTNGGQTHFTVSDGICNIVLKMNGGKAGTCETPTGGSGGTVNSGTTGYYRQIQAGAGTSGTVKSITSISDGSHEWDLFGEPIVQNPYKENSGCGGVVYVYYYGSSKTIVKTSLNGDDGFVIIQYLGINYN